VTAPLVLENETLRIAIDPAVGGTITEIRHNALDVSVLGTVPWTPKSGPSATIAAPDEMQWLPYYTGGWPLLFPNGGDACAFEGVAHGFHGEASLAAWDSTMEHGALVLRRDFVTVPVAMERRLSLDGDVLTIHETVRMRGPRPIRAMWGQHPTFGSDLLAGPFEIASGARRVIVDDRYDPPANPLTAGAGGTWPIVPGRTGAYDLRRPDGRIAAMAYLLDFASPWAAIRRTDTGIAAVLSWSADIFPYAWLWIELGGTEEAPWNGQARLIGIEPNTTWPGNGLADTARRHAPLLRLDPGAVRRATVRLQVLRAPRPIAGVDGSGRAL
jgi:galactose mutarotase-like enzyme